jgi:hypothetical protein
MASSLALRLSRRRRRDLCGSPSYLPSGPSELIGELPLLRRILEEPEVRLSEGSWYAGGATTEWHLRSRHPVVQVVFVLANTDWCCRTVLSESRQPHAVGIPLPKASILHSHDTDAPMLNYYAGSMPGRYRSATGWAPQSIERLQAWISAAEEYWTRKYQILADLDEWAAEAALLDYRKPSHADRIARAVPPQRRAMERLHEASDAYDPVYQEIAVAMRGAPDSPVDPSESLLRWADQRLWLVVNDGRRIHITRADAMPDRPIPKYWDASEVDYMGNPHRLAHLPQLGNRHVTHEASGETLEVVWDRTSIERCDNEIAELWKELDAEHDLPSDFASLWKAFFGYEFEAAYGWNSDGTRSTGIEPRPTTTSVWYGSGGVGGGDAGGCGGGV